MPLAPRSSKGALPSVASDEAQAKLKEKIKDIGLRDREREVESRAAGIGLPYINLRGFPINTDSIALIPEETADSLSIICFWYAMNDLRIGVVDPENSEALAYAKKLGEQHFIQPNIYLISEESFKVGKQTYARVPKLKKAAAGVSITEEDLNLYGENISSLKDLEVSLRNLTTTSAVATMIAGGLKTRATDVHLEAEESGVKLRYRIDGVLYTIATLPPSIAAKAISRLKLLSGLKINVSDRPQDGRFTINLTKDKVDVRASALPTAHGESIVMRLLRWSASGVDFEKLGLIGQAHRQLTAELSKPNGMIISTGPTGSGKTTTLYAIINKLNNAERKIITIEDPIEYRLTGVNQSQVDTSHGYTFANGLRSILRQDPNIVMVGEIRDPETAEIAVQAALTGHLVLSTLHTNDAAGAIPRFLSLGARAELLPSGLNAVIGQRLVRRLCESCKKPHIPDASALKTVEKALNILTAEEKTRLPAIKQFFTGVGCDNCQGIGYKGQIGIFEILLMSKDLKLAIAEKGISDTRIAEIAKKGGMVTMLQDGILKALAGITSLEEVFRVTKE